MGAENTHSYIRCDIWRPACTPTRTRTSMSTSSRMWSCRKHHVSWRCSVTIVILACAACKDATRQVPHAAARRLQQQPGVPSTSSQPAAGMNGAGDVSVTRDILTPVAAARDDLTSLRAAGNTTLPPSAAAAALGLPGVPPPTVPPLNTTAGANLSSYAAAAAAANGLRAGWCPHETGVPAASSGILGTVHINTSNQPFAAVGELYNSQGGRCTGALISPCHVLTAGHCLLGDPSSREDAASDEPGSFFPGVVVDAEWLFVPGSVGQATPLGVYQSRGASVSRQLADSGDESYDVAVIALSRNVASSRARPFKFEAVPDDWIPVCGLHYAGYPFRGVPWYQHCYYAGQADGNNLVGTSCLGRPGVSGAPMWTFGPGCTGGGVASNGRTHVNSSLSSPEGGTSAAGNSPSPSPSPSPNPSPSPSQVSNIASSSSSAPQAPPVKPMAYPPAAAPVELEEVTPHQPLAANQGPCEDRYLRAVMVGGTRGLAVAVSLQADVVAKLVAWMEEHPCPS